MTFSIIKVGQAEEDNQKHQQCCTTLLASLVEDCSGLTLKLKDLWIQQTLLLLTECNIQTELTLHQ